jgi:hypothetical protein
MSLSESFNFAISKLLIPLSRIKISYSVRSISTSEEVSSRARLNLYPDLNFQNSSIHGQGFDDAGLIPSDSRHTFISSVNLSGAISEDTDQYFTISCSDF